MPTVGALGSVWNDENVTILSLVRHGQTDWNLQHRIQGSTDIPLNETGRDQAHQSSRALAASHWDAIYTSPLLRAAETAEIIAQDLGLAAPKIDPRIVERSFGEVEGMTDTERSVNFPVGSIVPGAESREDLRKRGVAAINDIADAHPGQRVIVVAHGGVLGQILRHISNDALPGPKDMIPNGSSTVVRRDENGNWHIVSESIVRGVRDHAPII